MLLRVQHETKLSYSEPVSETVFDVRMAPPSDEDQTNLGYRLRIAPSVPVTIYRDGFGNRVDLFNIITPYSELIIRATSIVRTHRAAAPELRLEETACEALFAEPMAIDALEYLQPSPLVSPSSELHQFIAALKKPEGSLKGICDQLMGTVTATLAYEKKVTTARTPVGEALRLGRGVCQDFAHLFLGRLSRDRPAGTLRERLCSRGGRGGHPRLVPGMDRQDGMARRRPDPQHLRR